MMKDIQEYHLEFRVLQLPPTPISYMREPDYGFTSPYYVFSHDQVRPQRLLCFVCDATHVLTRHPQLIFPYDFVSLNVVNASEHTIETTGIDKLCDSVMKPNDEKRFFTVNFIVPMELGEDQKNFPKAHIVFKASNYHTADDWHYQEERNGWDPRVVVSFQENMWVDTPTHLHGLAEVMGPINEHLVEVNMRGVQIEDNLFVHRV